MEKKRKNRTIDLAKKCVEFALDKKGINPIILEVKNLTELTDYFLICSGTSSRHIRTIAENIVEKLEEKGAKPFRFEADNDYSWVVIDIVDVIIHIFSEEKREFYRLEQLWGDAKQIKVKSHKA